jgi:hypothetical protein
MDVCAGKANLASQGLYFRTALQQRAPCGGKDPGLRGWGKASFDWKSSPYLSGNGGGGGNKFREGEAI